MKCSLTSTVQTTVLLLLLVFGVNAQAEVLTNADVVGMSKAGLGSDVILNKIRTSQSNFDTTAKALIELKKETVDDRVISAIIKAAENAEKLKTRQINTVKVGNTELSEVAPKPTRNVDYKTPVQLLSDAKTIFLRKDSLFPKIKELEGSLLKQSRSAKWNKFELAITQYEADADLIVDIGHDFGTHYNFRVTDVKTGRVIAASGVSSFGGALAGNVADKLIKKLNEITTQK